MLMYIAKKSIVWVPLIIMAIFVAFMYLIALSPRPLAFFSSDGTPEAIQAWRELHGLHEPLLHQFVRYIAGVFRGELGFIIMPRAMGGHDLTITPTVTHFTLYTLRLALTSLFASLALALPVGAIAAAKKNTWIDALIKHLAIVGVSMPIFALGMLLITMLTPLTEFGVIYLFLLPSITLSFGMFCALVMSTRNSCLKIVRQNYITSARANGLPEHKIIFKHILRNTLAPTLSALKMHLGMFFGGIILVEFLFHRPGIGRLLMQGVLGRNYALALACVVMFIFSYAALHIVIDIAQAIIDPRVREWDARVAH